MAGKETVSSADLTGDDVYRLLTSIIVPRPIAWVSTVSAGGVRNLAPHSYFNGVSSSPPLVMFSAELTGDTAANIRSTGEFVVNTVSVALAVPMETTASRVDTSVDEFALAGLTPVAAVDVEPPLIDESPASLECVVRDARPFGDSLMVVGEVVRIHYAARADGRYREARTRTPRPARPARQGLRPYRRRLPPGPPHTRGARRARAP